LIKKKSSRAVTYKKRKAEGVTIDWKNKIFILKSL
jgi:hypothetical protein